MGAMSNYLETAMHNAVFKGVAFTPPTALYLALYTSNPTDADVGNEVTGGAYSRQSVVFGDIEQIEEVAVIALAETVSFPVATAPWGNVTHLGIRDAAEGGNMYYYAPLTTAKYIDTGDRVVFLANDITVALD